MILPQFHTTEEALAFGAKHWQDSEILEALDNKRATHLCCIEAYHSKPKTKTRRQLAQNHAFLAQLCREALEAAKEEGGRHVHKQPKPNNPRMPTRRSS